MLAQYITFLALNFPQREGKAMTFLVRLETDEECSLRMVGGFQMAREVFPHLWRVLPGGASCDRLFVETVCALDPQASRDVRGWAEQQEAA